MSPAIDWSFVSLPDPLAGMEKACSFSPSIDITSDAFPFDNVGVLPDCDYTSIPYNQGDSFFDPPLYPSTETCKAQLGFADSWITSSTLTPLSIPKCKIPNVPANSPINMTVDMNEVCARDVSPTPSLCADGDYLSAHSPASLKRSYSSSSSPSESHSNSGADDEYLVEEPATKRPKRRVERPRLDRSDSSSSSSASSKSQARVPHNQVERKYREGLNIQLEQLRRAVPTLCQVNDGEQGKPSKATVLVGAIAYIKKIVRERDELAKEVEGRKAAARTAAVTELWE
ncbi:hypothetical protein BDV96DRAFT_642154 [Lophiotrema nucula]|uniref:BHLH domain-containing protein n=1 Tax=Lophiotrema nucula TaxID=690887 RepID=A0A6A5ZQ09_9PLEO|nr:hypothetical protein BDV96DRAFT_642154 [Lophiotrema nucula]